MKEDWCREKSDFVGETGVLRRKLRSERRTREVRVDNLIGLLYTNKDIFYTTKEYVPCGLETYNEDKSAYRRMER
jgi:hypothetical protein